MQGHVVFFRIVYMRIVTTITYRVHVNYRRILQNHILTNTEQNCMLLLPFERGMFAVSE
jgi:hypothetical protein